LSIRGLEERRWRREGGRINEDIDRMTAILSHLGDSRQPFSALLSSQKMLNEDKIRESGFSE
jgi:hypothetical protein